MASPCAAGDAIADIEGFREEEFDPGKEVSYTDLQLFTDNFNAEKVMGRTQFGMLYRAIIPQGWKGGNDQKAVTVKMWDTKSIIVQTRKFYDFHPEYVLARMKDEIRFLNLPSLQSNRFVGKVLGYCFEEKKLGVVYDVNPLDTVFNLIYDADKFDWPNRVKVAIELARFLSFCHGNTPKYIVRNLSPAHIVVDQDFNPVLVDFAMILGGDIGDGSQPRSYRNPIASDGYVDYQIFMIGIWTDKIDVYIFGTILLELIAKCTSDQAQQAVKVDRVISVDESDEQEEVKEVKCFCAFKRKKNKKIVKVSFVNSLLRADPKYDEDDGSELTKLSCNCLEEFQSERPTMLEIVDKLEKLHVII